MYHLSNLENVVGKEKLKKIDTILKKFLAKNKTDPDYLKAYINIDEVDFAATDKTTACMIMFRNKYDTRHTGIHYYQEHDKTFKKIENQAAIDEIAAGYPDVPSLFHNLDLTDYLSFEVNQKEIEDLIKVNDSMIDLCKIKSLNPVCRLLTNDILDGCVHFIVEGVESLYFDYSSYCSDGEPPSGIDFTYNPELLANILKSIKELKKFTDKATFYYKEGESLVVRATDVDYEYTFILARKIS
ncbi:hypothetical protein vBBak6_009 [Bacillus phage v_B-Bak6]|uniref:Uncharacterized protein n=1 Tax=Bacillus phage Basilisk TaxID=1296654 RepID=S5MLZ7_9CAUD|nr:hypothetical protein PP653_gp017 [Bacillus phage Basilisk]AGR46680.1 hypothetical protein BASILISK_17 [Bacillus phage Basilisk]AXY82971.1 hypothetical protein vBBak1_009 [Bacillus phage v_B-Bak1]AXY83091.1 hypothetical protein vBBak6_009 [Bacillus phage v_B-Bak6]